jgi:omega-amidase
MEDKKLNLTLIQPDTIWEDIDRNLEHLNGLINRNDAKPDIILLPEMFTTGFSVKNKSLAESINGKAFNWMLEKSKEDNSAIAGSIFFTENDKYYNRLFWINPGGEWFSYDKRHLFTMGNEDHYFEKGNKKLIITFRGWRICPLICYDLRFPVWSRNNNDYDLLIYAANWPAARNHVWDILLRARAIENQCFVAGVNRVGRDGENIHYIGESCVVHPKGYLVTANHEPSEYILNCTISLYELEDIRQKFPVLNDRD